MSFRYLIIVIMGIMFKKKLIKMENLKLSSKFDLELYSTENILNVKIENLDEFRVYLHFQSFIRNHLLELKDMSIFDIFSRGFLCGQLNFISHEI